MRYTFVKQHDVTDCAAACLAMVCLHYKKESTITKLRDMMGTDLKGTNLTGLSICADQLGFTSQAVRVDHDGFKSKFTLPAIANTITKEGLSHFVVVYKVTSQYVIIGDPAKDLMKMDIDEFLQDFTGVILLMIPDRRFVADEIENGSLFRRFVGLLMPHKKLFVYSILASILMTVLGIISSLFNKVIMDEILPYKLKSALIAVLLIFVVISLTQIVISFIRQWIMLYLSQKIDIPLMLGYFEHIYKLPMKFFSTRKTGDIMTRFSDAFTIKNIFTNIALTLIMDVTMAIITGIILSRMNLTLFAIVLVIMLVDIALVFIFKHPYKKFNEEQMQQASILNSQIIEGLRGVETIKGNANEEVELDHIEKEYIKSLRISFNGGMLSNIQGSISGVFQTVGNLVMMYFGVIQVIDNDISLGSLMAFMTLTGYFMDPIGRLVGLQLQIQEANISMKRLVEILDYDQEELVAEDKNVLETIDGDVEFKGITFQYGNRKPVLKDVSFVIPKGKKVALVGASGSGKSTLAKLLLRYYEPQNGEIIVDGVNIEDYHNHSIRKAISYVPQTIELFSKSIYDNIRVSKINSTLDEVKVAARLVDAHGFINKLPMKYNTYLEEAGNGLSGGEKQRIALARAMLKRNGLYVFDESTSNLDFGTENLIFDTIFNKLKNKSMLIIAHRLATIRNCDEIIVLDQGEIIEKGTHEKLLKQNGKYANLWEMQQGNYQINKMKENKKTADSKEFDENEMEYI